MPATSHQAQRLRGEASAFPELRPLAKNKCALAPFGASSGWRGAKVPASKSIRRKNMKRLFVVTLLVAGLAAVAGSRSVNQHRMVADGNPLSPFPWYVADGNPPPPFPPYPTSNVTGAAIPAGNASLERLTADGNPPPPFPPFPPFPPSSPTGSSTTA